MSDYDLLTRFMKLPPEDVERIVSRNKIQKLEELKLQVIGQNPQLLGVGTPSQQSDNEIGTESSGPNPMLGVEGPEGAEGAEGPGPEGMPGPEEAKGPGPEGNAPENEPTDSSMELEDPKPEDIKKYDLGIEDYDQVIDDEEIDWSEEN
jgi:hypothetical protein